uniref:Uncharacterized protein n=1 Tax=Fundulus heteroclitus TaxID=8078 RepID=A0A146SUQ8_FUNHE
MGEIYQGVNMSFYVCMSVLLGNNKSFPWTLSAECLCRTVSEFGFSAALSGSDAAVGRRGQLRYLGVERLIGPVLRDVIQVAVEVHQEAVVARLEQLAGYVPRLLPLPQHDRVFVFQNPLGVFALVHDDRRNPVVWSHLTAVEHQQDGVFKLLGDLVGYLQSAGRRAAVGRAGVGLVISNYPLLSLRAPNIHLREGQLRDGSQRQVRVEQRHAVSHANSAPCRAGREQQPVDAAAGEEAGVQVHLHISQAGELHLTHGDRRNRPRNVPVWLLDSRRIVL